MVETFYSVPGAPSIALLGDFHNGEYKPILASLEKRRPGLIFITGDAVYAKAPEEGLVVEEQRNVLPLLSGCVSLAPTFLSLGKGTVNTEELESYTSHNTTRLDVDGVVKKLLTTDYVKEELEGRPHIVEA